MTIVIAATYTEFNKAFSIPLNPKKNSKLSVSNAGVNDFGKLLTASGDDSVFTNSR